MSKAKSEPETMDQGTITTLNELMRDLEMETSKLQDALDHSFTWIGLLTIAENIYQLCGAIRDKIPKALRNDAIGSLCQHAHFVTHYASKESRGSVDSNFTSLKIDIKNVKEEIGRLERSLPNRPVTYPDLEFIDDPAVRGYVEESVLCLNAGVYRAAIVMAGCALESVVRAIHARASKGGPSNLPFSKLVDILEANRTLLPDQTAIVGVCRPFRNLTAHPSGYSATKEEAESLLQLAVSQLKKHYAKPVE